jgi:hypothetical protein
MFANIPVLRGKFKTARAGRETAELCYFALQKVAAGPVNPR